jgi:hypothetical protein
MKWLLVVVALLLITAIKILFRSGKNGGIDFSLFQRRERVMNVSEQKLFEELQEAFGEGYIILSKIRIEDFVETRDGDGKYGARGRIKSRHVDFLICDKITTAPLTAIELDGGSHRKVSVQERDLFVDELYQSIGLPIQHIHVGEDFEKSVTQIQKYLVQ